MLSRDLLPLERAVYRAAREQLSSDNQAEQTGIDAEQRDHAAAAVIGPIIDEMCIRDRLKESTEDWGWELFLVRDDEADTLRSGGHFDELAHGGGYALFELSEGGE